MAMTMRLPLPRSPFSRETRTTARTPVTVPRLEHHQVALMNAFMLLSHPFLVNFPNTTGWTLNDLRAELVGVSSAMRHRARRCTAQAHTHPGAGGEFRSDLGGRGRGLTQLSHRRVPALLCVAKRAHTELLHGCSVEIVKLFFFQTFKRRPRAKIF